MPMAETPFAQVGLLAVAVNCTGDASVNPLVGADTATVAPTAKLEARTVTHRVWITPNRRNCRYR
jgi:hypothetical protein